MENLNKQRRAKMTKSQKQTKKTKNMWKITCLIKREIKTI